MPPCRGRSIGCGVQGAVGWGSGRLAATPGHGCCCYNGANAVRIAASVPHPNPTSVLLVLLHSPLRPLRSLLLWSPAGTSVELDAESQVEASVLMEQRGQVPVGWYHSHPEFEARPSQKGALPVWLAQPASRLLQLLAAAIIGSLGERGLTGPRWRFVRITRAVTG